MSPRLTEPTYTDPAHLIYRALPLADALERADQRNLKIGDTRIEEMLIAVGEPAGGASTYGYRHDLIQHVMTGERDEDEALFDEAASHGRRGFYDQRGEPVREAYAHGCRLAEKWIADVTAVLASHGMAFDSAEIVSLMAEAA